MKENQKKNKLLDKTLNKIKGFFQWLWGELKDWHTGVIFAVVLLVMYFPVYGFYILGAVFKNAWLSAFATAYLAFWAGPFTPFFPLCIAITFGVKKFFSMIKRKPKGAKKMDVTKLKLTSQSDMKEDDILETDSSGMGIERLSHDLDTQSQASRQQAIDMMWSLVQYKEFQMTYLCALKEVRTKFDVLNTEFNVKYKRNPISSITARLKQTDSTLQKLNKKKLPLTLESVENNIFDMAGIRVVCSYIDDIYTIAEALLKQDDITLVQKKDYIKTPKPNGYRSLHLIISVPVFFAEQKKNVYVEVQIRTIAMDFWASLEHQLKYKKDLDKQEEIIARLKNCADLITHTDEEMLSLRKEIQGNEETLAGESSLLEKVKNLDRPLE